MGEELVAFRDLSLRYGGPFNQKNASSRPNSAVFWTTNRNETDTLLDPTLFFFLRFSGCGGDALISPGRGIVSSVAG